MNFLDAHAALRKKGSITIRFKTQGSDFIDVWASELRSGSRKGLPVIRIQWGNSSSTLDEYQWVDETKTSLLKYAQSAIEAALK